jgi:hypothetical protein
MVESTPLGPRPLARQMRWFLRAGALLAVIAGTQLTVLTEHTDTYFFWTIGSPITAAFLGSTFTAAAVLALIASRQRQFVRAQLALPAVGLVSTLLLWATLAHFDAFDHPISPIWVEVYAFLPPVIILLVVQQFAVPGYDPRPERRLPPWLRLVLAGQAAVMMTAGVLLFIASDWTIDLWPWDLTELTAMAVGGWLLGIGATAAYAAWHDDAEDVPRAAPAYLALGVLSLLTLARYPDDVAFGDPSSWVYVLVALSALAVGVYGTPIAWREGHLAAPLVDRRVFVDIKVAPEDGGVRVVAGVPREAAEAMDFVFGAPDVEPGGDGRSLS